LELCDQRVASTKVQPTRHSRITTAMLSHVVGQMIGTALALVVRQALVMVRVGVYAGPVLPPGPNIVLRGVHRAAEAAHGLVVREAHEIHRAGSAPSEHFPG